MIPGASFYGKLKDDYEYDKIWQYKMHEYIPFRVAPLLNCVEVIMINFNNKKTKRCFTGISNTELKLSYGAANLTELTEYDDNFTTLIKAIASLGHALIDNNDTADALSFLEYGISIGSDISSNYIDLAIIYAATDRFDDIRKLKEKAGMLKSLSRDNIIEQLNNMLK